MGGLKVGVGGGLSLGKSMSQPAATITQTAYGAEQSPNDVIGSGLQPWHLGVLVPVLAVSWLAFLRWSLPR